MLTAVLAVAVTCVLLAVPSASEEADAASSVGTVTLGDDVTAVIYDDGSVVISGSGAMGDFEYSTRPFKDYVDYVQTVTFASGSSVTSIGDYVFYRCTSLTSLTIPDSVTTIGSYAIYYTGLTSLTVGSGVTTLDTYAISGNTSLTSLDLSNVVSIGKYALAGNTSLTSITIPSSVTTIGDAPFYNCSSLTSITFMGEPSTMGCTNIGIPSTTVTDAVYVTCTVYSIDNWAASSVYFTSSTYTGAYTTFNFSAYSVSLYFTTTATSYTVDLGGTFSYTPTTNQSGATISLYSDATGCLKMSNGTISGTISGIQPGSYSVVVAATYSGTTVYQTISVDVQFYFTTSSTSNTVSLYQTYSYTPKTNVSGATMSIYSDQTGCLNISNGTVSGTISGIQPGSYDVVIQATYGGVTIQQTVTINVPVYIVEPADYAVYTGVTWTYTPQTSPSGATITLVSVTYEGTSTSSHTVASTGTALSGVFNSPGTYTITYTASYSGLSSINGTVVVVATDYEETTVSMTFTKITVSASSYTNTYYFIADAANWYTITWDYGDGSDTESGMTSVVHTFSAGYYTVTVTATDHDGAKIVLTTDVIATDSGYNTEAAIGVYYSYIFEVDGDIDFSSSVVPSWATLEQVEVDGVVYAWVHGTPQGADLSGTSFDVTVVWDGGSSSWTIAIRSASEDSLTFSVTTSASGLTFVISLTSNAAFGYVNWGDGGGTLPLSILNGDTEYTYREEGTYTVTLTLGIWYLGEQYTTDRTYIADVYSAYTVTFDGNGGTFDTTGLTNGSKTVREGYSLTLPSAAWYGYTFNGWYDGDVCVGYAAESYTPTADVTLTAQWTANSSAKDDDDDSSSIALIVVAIAAVAIVAVVLRHLI